MEQPRHGVATMNQRIYIIGTGAISRHHAAAAEALTHEAELYAADPNPQSLQAFQAEYPRAKVFASADAMLSDARAHPNDIVVVATPPRFHCSETVKALRSGRHVVCEKPFAMDMHEAHEMVSVAKQLGLYVSCASNRFLGWSGNLKVQQLVAGGAIGNPYLVDFIHRKSCWRTGVEYQPGSSWFLDKSYNGGGATMDWGVYDASVLVAILKPVKVTVLDAVTQHVNVPFGVPHGAVFDIETQAAASIRFELSDGSTIMVRYERTCSTHGEDYEAQGIYGTKGYLKWDWIPFGQDLRVCQRTTEAPSLASEVVYPCDPYASNQKWEYAPVHELDRYVRGDADATVLVNEKALEPFSIIRAIHDVAETGSPAVLDFS